MADQTRDTHGDAGGVVMAVGRAHTRPGPVWTFGIPLTLSLVLHALLLLITATVVWQVTSSVPPARPPVTISFSDPGQGFEADALTGVDDHEPIDDPPPPDAAAPEPALSALPRASSPADRPPVPVTAAPSLRGESTAAPAPGATPSLRGTGVDAGQATTDLVLGQAPVNAEVRFAGLGASNASSVVYVVDGSGPMVSSLPIVLDEVLRSVSRLGPSQKFGVVIFRRGRDWETGYEWFSPALIRATPDAIAQLADWLRRVEPRGSSNPIDGLRAAFSMEPDAIFLLSRSIERSGGGVWQMGRESALAELDKLNPAHPVAGTRPVVIKTIQFLDEDPTGVMQAIAGIHGGITPENPNPADAYTVIRRAMDLKAQGEGPDLLR